MPRRRASAAPLSRERIVTTALELLDEHGLAALSLRQVARRLGVHVTSLYNHVDSKQALLDAMVDHALSGIAPPPADQPWDRRLVALARGLYDTLAAHPPLVGILASEEGRPSAGAVVAGMEAGIAALTEAGLGPAERVSAYRGLIATVLGLVMTHTRGSLVSLDEADQAWLAEGPTDWGDRSPELSDLAPQFLITRPEDDLDFVLETFVLGIRSRGG